MKTMLTTLIASSLLLGALPADALAADEYTADTGAPKTYLEADRTPAGTRIAGETVAGLLAGVVVAPVVFFGTWAALEATGSGGEGLDDPGWARVDAAGVVGFAAGNLVIPAGVALAGDFIGGRGSTLGSYVGGVAAGGVVTALALVVGSQIEPGPDHAAFVMGSVVAIPLATTAGAILGYELTTEGSAPRADSAAGSLYPILALDPDGSGGAAGLGGRF